MRTLLGSSVRPSRTAILSGTDSAEQAAGPAVVVDLAEDVVRDVGAARPGPPHHLQPQGRPAVEAVEVALEVEIRAERPLRLGGRDEPAGRQSTANGVVQQAVVSGARSR